MPELVVYSFSEFPQVLKIIYSVGNNIYGRNLIFLTYEQTGDLLDFETVLLCKHHYLRIPEPPLIFTCSYYRQDLFPVEELKACLGIHYVRPEQISDQFSVHNA